MFNWLLSQASSFQPMQTSDTANVQNSSIEMDYQYHKAFYLLKEALMNSPVLVYPDLNKSYMLLTDASKYLKSAALTPKYTTSIGCKMVSSTPSCLCQWFISG